MKDEGRLRNRHRLKETEETQQLKAMSGPGSDPGAERKRY